MVPALTRTALRSRRVVLIEADVGIVQGGIAWRPVVGALKTSCTIETLDIMDRGTTVAAAAAASVSVAAAAFARVSTKRQAGRSLIQIEVDLRPADGQADARLAVVAAPLLVTVTSPLVDALGRERARAWGTGVRERRVGKVAWDSPRSSCRRHLFPTAECEFVRGSCL